MDVDNRNLVSVIIPAYNHEAYIQEAINSVIAQTYPYIEIIIIDDGSKDCTWNKIQEMKDQCINRFVKVVFETQINAGTCQTLNRLLQMSSGEYIQILASDDKLSNSSTQILFDFLSTNPDYSLAVGKNELIDKKGVICYWDEYRNNVYKHSDAKYRSFSEFLNKKVNFDSVFFGSYKMLLKGNHIPNGYLLRKNIFDKIGFFTVEAPLEDYWLMLQISKFAKMKYIDKTTFYYRWHGENTANQDRKMKLMTRKTLQYEMDMISSKFETQYQGVFNSVFSEKVYFQIPLLIKLYREKNPKYKKLILKIFSYKIVLNNIEYID